MTIRSVFNMNNLFLPINQQIEIYELHSSSSNLRFCPQIVSVFQTYF